MKQRLDYIDRMKGFAIPLMVLGNVYPFACSLILSLT